ncbi:MAG TPA: hypothetical protein VFF86_03250 [Candidatus Methylomirabilis sp.]|nr:hypothetical protein [Candidatus Methylomirabilis sp.]
MAAPRNTRSVKLVIPKRLPKGRVPHRPTRVEPSKPPYDRRRGKLETDRAKREVDEISGE